MDPASQQCAQCDRPAVIIINAGDTPLCGYHYVLQKDDACLLAHLRREISEYGEILYDLDIQRWIKRLRPKVYEQLQDYFQE